MQFLSVLRVKASYYVLLCRQSMIGRWLCLIANSYGGY